MMSSILNACEFNIFCANFKEEKALETCVKITYAILFRQTQLCWAGKQLLVLGTLLQ